MITQYQLSTKILTHQEKVCAKPMNSKYLKKIIKVIKMEPTELTKEAALRCLSN